VSDPTEEYRRVLAQAERLRETVPPAELLRMSQHGFIIAHDDLAAVVKRLGQRQADITELLSVAKSMHELARKMRRMTERIAPELEDNSPESE
jgi:hypothetical protein